MSIVKEDSILKSAETFRKWPKQEEKLERLISTLWRRDMPERPEVPENQKLDAQMLKFLPGLSHEGSSGPELDLFTEAHSPLLAE